jgi:hypothetical protein
MLVRQNISQYITRSARIEDYDKANGNHVEHEISANNKDADIFLTQLQKKIRVGPSYRV